MARAYHILHNPASELELPRLAQRLPKAVLSAAEVEQIMLQTDIHDPLGLRDRGRIRGRSPHFPSASGQRSR
jgi:integrase/recombinase XerD